jgi:hypothetical protein
MTTAEPSREDAFIDPFLSAYEGGDWTGAQLAKPDAIDRTKPAVDKLAIRNDGRTLAIEHTIIEPFVGEKEDFAFFEAALLAIEADQSLAVPGRFIQVFVPVGALKGQSKTVRDEIAKSIHDWINSNRLAIAEGRSQAQCKIPAVGCSPSFEITLTVKAVRLKSASGLERGSLHVRRQQIENNLCAVIEKALRRKLPKLVNAKADKRILVLERQHMNLLPEMILEEIEKLRSSFSDLARVDEIWILETPFYGTSFGGTYFRFERYEGGELVADFDFNTGV